MNETLYLYLLDRMTTMIETLHGELTYPSKSMLKFFLRKDKVDEYINLSEDGVPRPRIIKLYKEVINFNSIII